MFRNLPDQWTKNVGRLQIFFARLYADYDHPADAQILLDNQRECARDPQDERERRISVNSGCFMDRELG